MKNKKGAKQQKVIEQITKQVQNKFNGPARKDVINLNAIMIHSYKQICRFQVSIFNLKGLGSNSGT